MKTNEELMQMVVEPFEKQILRITNGMDDDEACKMFDLHLEAKRNIFYSKYLGGNCPSSIFRGISRADSKAEKIMFKMFEQEKIMFHFQENIGSYRVDFLFDNKVILECDGPQHLNYYHYEYDVKRDKWLTAKGYTVFRIQWQIIAMGPEVLVQFFKDIQTSENNDLTTKQKKSFFAMAARQEKEYLARKIKEHGPNSVWARNRPC